MSRILLVDDEPLQHVLFGDVAAELGHELVSAQSLSEGREKAARFSFDVIFLDVMLPDGNGIEHLPFFKEQPNAPEVIVITSKGDIQGAERTLKDGGGAYLLKPLTVGRIEQSIKESLRFREHDQAVDADTVCCDNIVGGTRIEECKIQAAKAARSDVAVVIYGETGTGKELFARAVHDHGPRSIGPFVALDCASLAPHLISSLLFGHVRGAFTGADRDRDGVVAMANKGTLFLDEIGELPPDQQASLLRVLETRRFRPVGGQRELESDFRLVAATNRNLEEIASLGLFRNDLLYRLQGITITLPPLRERLDDIPLLAEHHLKLSGHPDKTFSKEFMSTLVDYDWPGNVRELVHALDSAFASAHDSPVIYERHLPVHIRIKAAQGRLSSGAVPLVSSSHFFPTLKEYRDGNDRSYIEKLLEYTDGNVKKAAEAAGISRGYLYEMLKKFGLRG